MNYQNYLLIKENVERKRLSEEAERRRKERMQASSGKGVVSEFDACLRLLIQD